VEVLKSLNNKPVFSLFRQPLLLLRPLLLGAQRRTAIGRYLLSAGRSAANPPHADDRRDRQTDRLSDRFIDPWIPVG